ncbi:MAG: hypothetical protein MI785_02315 [Kiloniellales bacterium]|nr:hypothetical protein [Kiloniellales bacterium]
MKRGLAIVGGIVVVLILVVGIGGYFLLTNLGSIVVAAVERYGSEVTRTQVSLADAKVDLTSGEGALSGLKVGNPSGFQTDSAFSLGEISVKLDTGSVTEKTIVVKEIAVSQPEVTYEVGATGSNIDAIRQNVEAFSAAQGGGAGGADQPAGEGGDGARKLVIDDLYIRGGTVKVSATFLEGETLSAVLPDIHLTDIGKDAGGATPQQVVERIVAALGDETGKVIAGMNLDALRQGAEGAVNVITEGAGAAAGAAEEAGGAAGEALEEGTEEAEGAIKKLLGN